MFKSIRAVTKTEIIEGAHQLDCGGSLCIKTYKSGIELRLDRAPSVCDNTGGDGWCTFVSKAYLRELIDELEAIHANFPNG